MSSSTLAIIQTQLNLYGYSISMLLGNIGNVFVVILFNRTQQSACSIYLISSAIVNSLYLIFSGFNQLFPFNYNNQTTAALVFCKLESYIISILGEVSKIMLVLACIDRYMMTSDHVTFRAFSTPKRAKYAVLFSIIIVSLFNIHISIMFTIINEQCVIFGIYGSFFAFYILITLGLLPPVTSGIFGYLSYRNVSRLRNRVQPFTQNTNVANAAPIRRRDRELLVIVISEVFVYIITSIPFPLVSLESTISDYIVLNKSVQYWQIEGFMSTIGFLLLYMNSAAPFYTYLVASKPFRQEFKQLIINNYRKIRGHQPNATVHRTDQTNTQKETRV